MDPDANILEQAGLVREMIEANEINEYDARRLADLVEALITWLARDGYAPNWKTALRELNA